VTTAKASAARPFDAVLCDIDNVIRFYDHTGLARLERAAGLEPGATAKVAFSDEVDGPLLMGRIGKEEWTAEASRCLFVDDRLENVDAATALGMTGLHYREPADLRQALAFLEAGQTI
jgi:hypothetical protein